MVPPRKADLQMRVFVGMLFENAAPVIATWVADSTEMPRPTSPSEPLPCRRSNSNNRRRGCGAATADHHHEGVAQSAFAGRELGLCGISGHNKSVGAACHLAPAVLWVDPTIYASQFECSIRHQRDARRGRVVGAGDVAGVCEAVAAREQFGHEAEVGVRILAVD